MKMWTFAALIQLLVMFFCVMIGVLCATLFLPRAEAVPYHAPISCAATTKLVM